MQFLTFELKFGPLKNGQNCKFHSFKFRKIKILDIFGSQKSTEIEHLTIIIGKIWKNSTLLKEYNIERLWLRNSSFLIKPKCTIARQTRFGFTKHSVDIS